MSVSLAPLVLLVTTLSPVELEYRGTQHVVQAFEQADKPVPEGDPALARAARRVAQEALEGDETASDALSISEALSDMRGWDPNPRALVFRGTPPSEALKALLDRVDLAKTPTSHVGIGAAFKGDRAAVVVFMAERKAELEPFPRGFPRAGATQALCGHLNPPLEHPEVYVTRPNGQVEKTDAEVQGNRFCAPLAFGQTGRHTVEVVAHGPGGPEVDALFFVDAGSTPQRGKRVRVPEPTTLADARRLLLERINALRTASGAPTLERDEMLDQIAQAYSDQMAKQNFFSHVAPEGLDIKARLRNAGYLYQLAGENLAMASGPLAAHFGIEHSPGHRKNLLEPGFTRVGIGVTFQKLDDHEQVLLTELYTSPNRDFRVMIDNTPWVDTGLKLNALDAAPGSATAQALAYRRLEEYLKAANARPPQRSEELELVALEQARRSRDVDVPFREVSDGARVFARQRGLGPISVVVSKLTSPDAPPRMPEQAADACGRVGVSAVRTEPGKPEAYWVAVVCAKPE